MTPRCIDPGTTAHPDNTRASFANRMRVRAIAMLLCVALGVSLAPEIFAATAVAPTPPPPRPIPVPSNRPALSSTVAPGPEYLRYRTAFELAKAGKWRSFFANSRKPLIPDLEQVLHWMRLKHPTSGASFAEIAIFIDQHSDWPNQRALIRQAELALKKSAPLSTRLAWFKTHPPKTLTGRMAQIEALSEAGLTGDMTKAIREVWRVSSFTRKGLRNFRRRYKTFLSLDDHWQRLDRLLWKGHTNSARHMLLLVDKDHRALADARIKLRRSAAGVDTAIDRVPPRLRNNPGLVYERLRWRNRKGRKAGGRDLLWGVAPQDEFEELWWRERARQIRYALDDGAIEDAYLLASAHIQRNGRTFADAEWHAGWVALRFRDKPGEALHYFKNLHDRVSTAISQARAAYWAGRAAEASNKTAEALNWYRRAAKHVATFYGQLAWSRLGESKARLPEPAEPSDIETKAFEASSMPRATTALARADQPKLVRRFLRHMAREAKTAIQSTLIARLALHVDASGLEVYAARRAARHGHVLAELGYPTLTGLEEDGPELALVHAIIRQESGFDDQAISRVGARGLMQLMPATAKLVAKMVKVSYSKDRLLSDRDYNLKLGQAYLGELLERYQGNYVLALAAYNAGPHRVKRWIKLRGDPRSADVDIVDWIERIPYSETRNYVQRVLEGLNVYRLRLDHAPLTRIAATSGSPLDRWCVTTCGDVLDQQDQSAELPNKSTGSKNTENKNTRPKNTGLPAQENRGKR